MSLLVIRIIYPPGSVLKKRGVFGLRWKDRRAWRRETANLNLLHDLFNLRRYGRSEFLLCFRRQMKAVSAIGRDDRVGVKEVGAPRRATPS